MKICSQCSTQCPDDASVCNKCGNSFLPDYPTDPKIPDQNHSEELSDSFQIPVFQRENSAYSPTATVNDAMPLQKRALSRMHILLIIFGGIAIVLTAVLLLILSRPSVDSYFDLLYAGKNKQAIEYYEKHFQGQQDKKTEIQNRAISELSAIQEDYINQIINYDTANAKYLMYYDVPGISAEYSKITNFIIKLQASRTAFNAAKSAEESKDTPRALENYTRVIQEDDNYASAQERIKTLVPIYNAEMLKLADSYLTTKEYQNALTAISNALKFDPKSAALQDKLAAVKKADADAKAAAEKARVDAMYNAQPVIVTSCASRNRGYRPGYREAVVIMKNNSGKAIKELTVAALLFDANGKPILNAEDQRDDNLYLLNYNTNVSKNAKFGDGSYWVIPKNATKIKACVVSITYSDGSTWTNEAYYEHWYNAERYYF